MRNKEHFFNKYLKYKYNGTIAYKYNDIVMTNYTNEQEKCIFLQNGTTIYQDLEADLITLTNRSLTTQNDAMLQTLQRMETYLRQRSDIYGSKT